MITLQDVQAARERIGNSICVSPCSVSHVFSEMTGNRVSLKLENLQRTGSYKERGALNKILTNESADWSQRRPAITRRRSRITRRRAGSKPRS